MVVLKMVQQEPDASGPGFFSDGDIRRGPRCHSQYASRHEIKGKAECVRCACHSIATNSIEIAQSGSGLLRCTALAYAASLGILRASENGARRTDSTTRV
jgi:hypothetical protein